MRFGEPHSDGPDGYTIPQLAPGESITLTGKVDNGFYGDSEIYIGDPTVDLDEAFKSLDGLMVRVTIERLEETHAE